MSGIMYTPDAQFVQPAIEMLKNESMRNFNIDIETDTLVQIDQQTEKSNRVEFLTSVSSFLEKVLPVGQQHPELVPLLGEMLLFGIRGFKIGRTIEGSFEQFVAQATQNEKAKAAQPPQPPPPTPEMIRAQTEAQNAQAKLQADQQTAQSDMQMEHVKMQADQQKQQLEMQQEMQIEQLRIQAASALEAQRLQFEQWKVETEIEANLNLAKIGLVQQMQESNLDTLI